MATRTCLECGERITGRSDKKFCTDYCRNTYHNRQNSDQIAIVRTISFILRKNRRILDELNTSGKTKIKRKKLAEKGFNFSYHTHCYTTSKNIQYCFCYDQGYCELEKDELLLVRDSKPLR